MREFVGTKVKEEEWGVSQNTIAKWCREKKITEAE